MKNDSGPVLASGLEGVISAETRLSAVDGEAGELIIAGFLSRSWRAGLASRRSSTCCGTTRCPILESWRSSR